MNLWLWSYFPEFNPTDLINFKFTKYSSYSLHYLDLDPRKHTFDTCFTFFYSNLVDRSFALWKPCSRNFVPEWLRTPPSNANGDKQFEVWASFLIFGDLPYGISASPNNNKCGVEYYNLLS